MDMKQTAVEWLFKWMIDNKDLIIEERLQAFEKAKEMEKEQIVNAYETAMETDIYNEPLKIGKDYYNETFKSE
jgi:hypothetical protein